MRIQKQLSIDEELLKRVLDHCETSYQTFSEYVKRLIVKDGEEKTSKPDLTNLTQNELDKMYYSQLLDKYGGNKAEVARRVDINVDTLKSRLRKLGL